MLCGNVTALKAEKIKRQKNDLTPGRIFGGFQEEVCQWIKQERIGIAEGREVWGDGGALLKQMDNVGYNLEGRKFPALG